VANKASDEDSNLDGFEMTSKTSKPSKTLVKREVDLFRKYPEIKDIKCLLDWWAKHEPFFRIIAFLTCQILGIVGFKINTKNIFSLTRIFTNLKRCHL
jgi:hypothetical protein